MAYVVAACVAGILGALEQYNRLKTKPTKADHAWRLWTLRVLLEAGIGAAALAVVEAAEPSAAENALTWLAAGAAGPAAVRLRIIDVGTKDEATPVGLATIYEPIRDWIAKELDDIGATAQSNWLDEELLPILNAQSIDPKRIGDRVEHWVEGSERFSEVARVEEIKYIHDTLEADEPDALKREVLVKRAIKLGAFRLLRDIHRSCVKAD